MSQSIIAAGDLVRYHIRDADLDALGFIVGAYYEVKSGDGILYVNHNETDVYLEFNGDLTDRADSFTKHRCPVTLPLGQIQRRLNG